ncbi:MAG TPA: YceI family protein [Polyangiales bacterium]|nr:YceI family protein [Polyangiales bacterium]
MNDSSPLYASPVSQPATGTVAENKAIPDVLNLTEWTIDAAHTRVAFSVSHLVVSEVDGQFKSFSGKVQLDDADLTRSKLAFKADVASIDTGVADRDMHLKSPDFFDAATYPTIEFESTSIEKNGKSYQITGDLSMRGVTKPVTLAATLSAAVTDPWGKQVRAARVTGTIKRQDFGVSWNKSLDKGGVVVGNDVSIDVKLELTK